jgi:hypothetical protein
MDFKVSIMKTTTEKTPFEKAVEAARNGKLKTPSVSIGTKNVEYFRYQLAVHKFNLSLMSKGMKSGNIKLVDFKYYYGLKGRTAKDCLPQFLEIFKNFNKHQ